MRTSWIIPALAAALVHGAETETKPATDDTTARKHLVGVWKGFAVEGQGERPDRGPVKLELTISETTIKGIESKGQGTIDHGEGRFTLDLKQSPRWLDAGKTNDRGRKEEYLGIYTLEGDTLKWCVTRQKQRPTRFETADRAFLLILKRQKP
jgi:uncharacterized protein (TIGR03067 family)